MTTKKQKREAGEARALARREADRRRGLEAQRLDHVRRTEKSLVREGFRAADARLMAPEEGEEM